MMAGNQVSMDALSSNLSGMSKPQLYDIMFQLRTLIDQNPDQAKEILVQNPLLTRALFQAQIMLGMVQAPQTVPNIQPAAASNNPKPPNTQLSKIGQTSGSQLQAPPRKQPNHPFDGQNQTQSLPTNPQHTSQQSRGYSNMPPIPQPARSAASTQFQQTLPTSGSSMYVPSQPPLPAQSRPPPSAPAFSHPQTGNSSSFQHAAPQLHQSQPMYQPSIKPPAGTSSSYPQGQPPVASQAPYLGFGGGGSSGGWMPETASPTNFAGQASSSSPTTYIPGLMGPTNPPPQPPPPVTPELEKAVMQQLMSLGPEQVNMLPPDQRNQILQLQHILRNQH